MKRVLLTGASGFIGTHLKAKLLGLGFEVIGLSSIDGNIADGAFWHQLNGEGFEHVYHLAAKTFVPESWENPGSFFAVNAGGTQHALEFCRRYNIGLTYMSAYLYGQPQRLPIAEDCPIEPNNPYGLSKYLAEQLCHFYTEHYSIPVSIIRPFNVYGRGQSNNFLIPSIIRQAMNETEIKIKDIYPKRDYLYIDDLVEAMMLSANLRTYNVYNIGSGYSVSVGQIIELVQGILGSNKPVVSAEEIRKNEINDVIADISKANRELNWFPKYSILTGLEEVIRFAQEEG